jgi:ATP/maltotriose-dependent transcriptional regulator MalT
LNEAVINLAAAEVYLDRFDEAGERAEQALALARARGQGQVLPILFWTGTIRTTLGRLPEAAEVFDAAVEFAQVNGHAAGLAWNLCGRSLAANAAGDSRAALTGAERAIEALRGLDRSFLRVAAGIALAAALLADGDYVGAADTLADNAGGEELSLVPRAWQPATFELLTRCQLAQGRQERAARAAGRARVAANRLGLQMPSALADRASALVALAAGDTRSAAEVARRSAASAQKVGAPIEAALSRQLAGRALTKSGERRRAVTELECAAILFDDCGALPRRDEVERELGRLGRRPHRRTGRRTAAADGLEPLTQRELQVARLVVDRRTNAEIAAELFLSRKTVETHIRHLFEKLRVSSRVDVARVVERAERTLSET